MGERYVDLMASADEATAMKAAVDSVGGIVRKLAAVSVARTHVWRARQCVCVCVWCISCMLLSPEP